VSFFFLICLANVNQRDSIKQHHHMNKTTIQLATVLYLCFLANTKALEVTILGSDGKHIPSSEAAIILKSGAYQKGTPEAGRILFEPFTGQARIFLAAPGYEAESRPISDAENATFTLKPSPTKDSIIIYGRRTLPEKGGDINPILDTQNRMYMYGLGIGLFEGTIPAKQPLAFRLKSAISAQDSQGKRFKIYVVDISQTASLVEYTK
jgi:hypothetical protein